MNEAPCMAFCPCEKCTKAGNHAGRRIWKLVFEWRERKLKQPVNSVLMPPIHARALHKAGALISFLASKARHATTQGY